MEIKVITPDNCTKKELNDFCQLAKKGGQVSTRSLMNRIRNTKLLAFGYVNEELASISSIKVPFIEYKNRIFKSSSIECESHFYSFELGYSMTIEKHRGNGYNFQLNSELLSKLKLCKVYATTANPGMIYLLEKLNFVAIGEKYKGKYNDKLQLYSLNIK